MPHTSRILAALGRIDTHRDTPTSVRSILSSYYRFVNASGTTEHLPRALRPHPRFRERAANHGSRYDVLLFHLGSAIKALQEAYAVDRQYVLGKAKVEAVLEAIPILDGRVTRLERLASVSPLDWVVRGDEPTGFYLITSAEARAMKDKEKAIAVQLENDRPENPLPEEEPVDDDQETI